MPANVMNTRADLTHGVNTAGLSCQLSVTTPPSPTHGARARRGPVPTECTQRDTSVPRRSV